MWVLLDPFFFFFNFLFDVAFSVNDQGHRPSMSLRTRSSNFLPHVILPHFATI